MSALFGACSTNLLAYAIAAWPQYEAASHLRLIARKLEAVADGRVKRLLIHMPPRHGKSHLVSTFFPAWYLGRRPDHQIIFATYAQDLADDFGRKVRNQMTDPLFQAVFGEIGLAGDSRSASDFVTTAGGEYHALGVGGPGTGRGAHVLIIDDATKNREDAESLTMRRKLKDWYTSVAYTRLMPEGAIVVVATRWHEDDLPGWLLKEHGHEGWEVLSLPALDESNAALWPEKYPVERLVTIRQTVGPRDWEALYMQRPRAPEGGEFLRNWIQRYVNADRGAGMNKLILVDPASQKRKGNDFTSMWVIGLGPDRNAYALDIVRDRLNLQERAQVLFDLHRKWKPYEVRYERYGMMGDIEHLQSRMEVERYRFPVTEVAGSLAKEDRIRRLIPLFQERRFYLPESLWYTRSDGKTYDLVSEFLQEEYLAFPSGKTDDMIDALSRLVEPGREFALRWPGVDTTHIPVVAPWVAQDAEAAY